MGQLGSHIDTQQPHDRFVNWPNFRTLVERVKFLEGTEFSSDDFDVVEDVTGRYIGAHIKAREDFPFRAIETTGNQVRVTKGDWVRNGTRVTMTTDVGEDFITLGVPTTASTNHLVILTLSDLVNGEDMHNPDTLTASIIEEGDLDEDERFIVKVIARMENSSGSGSTNVVFTSPDQLWWGGDLGDTPHFFPFEVREETSTSVFVRGGRWTRNDNETTAGDITISGFSGSQTEFVVATLDDLDTPITLTISRSATNPNGNDSTGIIILLAEVTTVAGAITLVRQRWTGGDREDVNASGLDIVCDDIDFTGCTGTPILCSSIDWTGCDINLIPCGVIDFGDPTCGNDILHTQLDFGNDDINLDSVDKQNNVDHDRHTWFALAAGSATTPIGFGTQDLSFHTTGECQADDFKIQDDSANNFWNAEDLRIDVTAKVLLEAASAAADAIRVEATAGGMEIDIAERINVAGDIMDILIVNDLSASAMRIFLQGTGSGADAIVIDSTAFSGGSGGMTIDLVRDLDITCSDGKWDVTNMDYTIFTALVANGNTAIDAGNHTHGWLTAQEAAIVQTGVTVAVTGAARDGVVRTLANQNQADIASIIAVLTASAITL